MGIDEKVEKVREVYERVQNNYKKILRLYGEEVSVGQFTFRRIKQERNVFQHVCSNYLTYVGLNMKSSEKIETDLNNLDVYVKYVLENEDFRNVEFLTWEENPLYDGNTDNTNVPDVVKYVSKRIAMVQDKKVEQ